MDNGPLPDKLTWEFFHMGNLAEFLSQGPLVNVLFAVRFTETLVSIIDRAVDNVEILRH